MKSVGWTLFLKDPTVFVSPEWIPDGFEFKEPRIQDIADIKNIFARIRELENPESDGEDGALAEEPRRFQLLKGMSDGHRGRIICGNGTYVWPSEKAGRKKGKASARSKKGVVFRDFVGGSSNEEERATDEDDDNADDEDSSADERPRPTLKEIKAAEARVAALAIQKGKAVGKAAAARRKGQELSPEPEEQDPVDNAKVAAKGKKKASASGSQKEAQGGRSGKTKKGRKAGDPPANLGKSAAKQSAAENNEEEGDLDFFDFDDEDSPDDYERDRQEDPSRFVEDGESSDDENDFAGWSFPPKEPIPAPLKVSRTPPACLEELHLSPLTWCQRIDKEGDSWQDLLRFLTNKVCHESSV